MAQSYDRRINLYINVDGKSIPNNVAAIKAELQKIVNQQARMTLGSKEYQEQTAKITYLRGILQQHNAEVNNIKKSWSMQGMADGFNRYMGLITAFAASATGLVLSFKQIIQSFNDYEERVDNLSALTGLAGDDLQWLSDKAKELSQSTLEGGIRVTQSAKDIIDAFTKTGSARPELLKNKEALVQVTQEAIILSDAAKMELYPAIEALTMVMNQYNVGADQARRIINVLAAGSKEGAGEVDYLTVAYEKAGTVASLANISIESLGAAIETLAPRITQPEIAGRSLKGVLLDLQTGSDDTNPAIVGLSTAIENLGKKNLSVTELTKKFGTENINTAQILIKNVDELKNYEKAMTGTNIAIEQATINTDNNNAKLAQARNRLNVMSIELGEKLAPALQVSTSGLSYLVKGLTISIEFFREHKVLIVSLVSSVVAYNLALKASAMLEAGLNREKGIGLAITKLSAFWNRAASASMLLYQAAVALLSGNFAKATRAMQLFWAFAAMTPIGAVTAVIIGLGTALFMLSGRLTAAQKAQRMLNDVNLEAQKNIVEEKIKVQTLLDLARNENIAKAERLKAIEQLNAISPKYLSGLTLENINTKTATQSVKDYTDALLENAKAQAAKEKLIEIEKQLLDLQSGNGADVSFWQGTWNAMTSGGNLTAAAAKNAATATENLKNKQEELTAQREKLLAITKKQAEAELGGGNGGNGGDTTQAQDLIKLKEKELADIQAEIASTPALVASRNARAEAKQKEIDVLRKLGTSDGQKDLTKKMKEDADAALVVLDQAHNERMAKLTIQYEKEGWSDQRFKAEQMAAELSYLTLKKALLAQFGQKTIETEAQISQKRIEMQKSLNDVLADGDKQLFSDIEESIKIDEKAIQSSIDASEKVIEQTKKQKDDEAQVLKERKEAYLQFAQAVGQSFGDLMMDQEATFGDYLKNTILMALEAFHQWFLIEKAKKIIEGISGGFVGAAIAIAKVAAMEIAYQGVRAAVMSAGSKKTGAYAAGGYAYEEQYVVSEGNKPEWIAPNWMLRNPQTAQIIAGLEKSRENGPYLSATAYQTSATFPSSLSNYSQTQNPAAPVAPIVVAGLSPADVRLFSDAVAEFKKARKSIDIVTIKKLLDDYDSIQQNRGLG